MDGQKHYYLHSINKKKNFKIPFLLKTNLIAFMPFHPKREGGF